jgi:hypothetical protein
MLAFSSVARILQCYDISDFRRGLVEVLALLGCYAAYAASYLPMFWDDLSVPSCTMKKWLPTSWQVRTPPLVMCYFLWMQRLLRCWDIRSKIEREYKRAVGIALGRRERNTATCGFVGCSNRRFIDICVCVCEGGGSDVKQVTGYLGCKVRSKGDGFVVRIP